MEPLAAAGLASAIITFVDIGTKIAKRMKELSEAGDIPEVFRDIKTRLPLIIHIISTTRYDGEALSPQARQTFEEVVIRCFQQVRQLDEILKKVVLGKGDSRLKKIVKASVSLMEEERINRIAVSLRDNVQLLTFLNVNTGDPNRPPIPRFTSEATPPTKDVKGTFLVPFSRDEDFVGRETSLSAIEDGFTSQARVAVSGIGGVGKSQVAIEYCYRFSEVYPEAHVLWIYGGTIARFYQGYKRIAQKLTIPGWDDPEASILELVSTWLSTTSKEYLLIIDNADNIEHWWPSKYKAGLDDPNKNLAKYLPTQTGKGKMLITTRDTRVASRLATEGKPVVLQPMSHEEAKQLFLSKLGSDQLDHDKADVDLLIEELDHLPLAMSQAAAFIEENEIAVADYLAALRTKDAEEFLDEELNDARRDEESVNSVFRTWHLSYDQIMQQKPAAADLLCLLAFLDRQSIPRFLLKMPEATTSLTVLQSFNMITTRAGSKSYQIHRLVQRFVQLSVQRQKATQKWQDAVLSCVSEIYPTEIGVAEWPVCDGLAPHVHIITNYSYHTEKARLDLAHLLCYAADFDIERGMYTQALDRAHRSLSIFSSLCSERDQRLAAATWLYGRLRYYQAKSPKDIEAATNLLKSALEIADYASLTYAETAFELAHLYYDQGRGESCLEFGKASFESWQCMGGPTSSRTLDNKQDYALELAMLGREEEGIACWQDIIACCPLTDASETTKTIYNYRSLASIAEFQGDNAVAEIFYRKLVSLGREMYHEQHMHLYDYRLSHAEQVMLQGDLDEAVRLSEEILEGCVNNSEWRIQASSLQTIAECLRLKAFHSEALPLRIRILEMHQKNLGVNHKETVDAQDALADCYLKDADHLAARRLHEEVFAWRHKELSPEHPETVRAIECLAVSHAHSGAHDSAETSYLDALDRQSKSRHVADGNTHTNPFIAPIDIRLSDNLQSSLYHQGKWSELETWSRRSCEVNSDDPDDGSNTASEYRSRAHRNLIHALERQGKMDEALEVRAGFLAIYVDDKEMESVAFALDDFDRVPTLPPTRHRRRFGRIIHPRTWSA